MSVSRIVLWSLKDDGIDTKKLAHLLDRCRSIPGLVDIQFGKNDLQMYPNKSESSGGNNYGLYTRHINADFLARYQEHPDQIALMNFLVNKATREPHAVDFRCIIAKL